MSILPHTRDIKCIPASCSTSVYAHERGVQMRLILVRGHRQPLGGLLLAKGLLSFKKKGLKGGYVQSFPVWTFCERLVPPRQWYHTKGPSGLSSPHDGQSAKNCTHCCSRSVLLHAHTNMPAMEQDPLGRLRVDPLPYMLKIPGLILEISRYNKERIKFWIPVIIFST